MADSNEEIIKYKTIKSSYEVFYNALVEIYNSYILDAKKKSEELGEDFSTAYVGNKQEVFDMVYGVDDSVAEIQNKANKLMDDVWAFIGRLGLKIATMEQQIAMHNH